MSDTAIRVILVDDHPIVLHGLRQLFEHEKGFAIVAACPDGEQALAAVRQDSADVLVLDLRMPGMTGLDVMRTIAGEQRPIKVVLLTAALRDAQVTEVIQLGARGLVLKESTPDALLECVRRVHQGEQWIDRAALSQVFDRGTRTPPRVPGGSPALTPRELEIVRMVAQGLRNREIAEKLSISEGTVKIHLHNTYDKLGVDGRLELLLYAQEKGLV
jgi:DNA-binding NarL/FixJ family response regulator